MTAALDPSTSTGSAPTGVFATFVPAASTNTLGFCKSDDEGGETAAAFEATNGTAVTDVGPFDCENTLTQMALFTALNNGTFSDVAFFNPSGGIVTVPPLNGANTGFTVPAGIDAEVVLTSSGSGFIIETGTFTFNSPTGDVLTTANTQSAATACANLGGSFSINPPGGQGGGLGVCSTDTTFPTDIGTAIGGTP